jgi:hypothetical protein
MLPLEEFFFILIRKFMCCSDDSDVSDSGTEEYFSNDEYEHELENLELS